MLSFERLIQEHELLLLMAHGLEACVAAAPDAVRAVRLRTDFSIALATHLRAEDARLYPRLAQSANSRAVGASETFLSELDTLKIDWNAYLEGWPDDAIASDWATFADETRTMMIRLRARIDRENACLYPVALQNSALRLRAA